MQLSLLVLVYLGKSDGIYIPSNVLIPNGPARNYMAGAFGFTVSSTYSDRHLPYKFSIFILFIHSFNFDRYCLPNKWKTKTDEINIDPNKKMIREEHIPKIV